MEYLYFRAGVLLGKFWIDGTVTCSKRDEKTMTWEARQQFNNHNNPFHPVLDLRLVEAVERIAQKNICFEQDYQFAETVCSSSHEGQLWVQIRGDNPLDIILFEGRIVATIDNERHYVGVLVEKGYEDLTPQRDFDHSPILSKPKYGIEFAGTHLVEMTDGIRLSTDVYLPVGDTLPKKLPVILIRTCYGKQNVTQFRAFVHYGYAMVIQDTRGRDQSQGEFRPMVNEMDDGKDTLDWLAQQVWCDGNVGMIGPSYLSIVQWAAAASGHPNLKAMISQVTGGVPIIDFPHRMGMLCSGTLAWAVSMMQHTHKPDQMERMDWSEIVKIRPINEIPKRLTGKESLFWQEWCEHEYYDSYWDRCNWLKYQHKINIPTLYVSGWYDDVGQGTMQAWDMNKRNRREHQKMITGAWRHKMNISREIHSINFGPDSVRYDMFYVYLKWYDKHLKGMENGIDKEPSVEYYVMGENRWRKSSEWPPEDSVNTAMYLHSGGRANTSKGDGVMSFHKPHVNESDGYCFDPQNATPFLLNLNENETLVPENYRDVEMREDVLVYSSCLLENDLCIAGEPKAIIYASSDVVDTDWLVRLTDVDVNGNSIRMSDGMVRARFRKSYVEPTLLLPGEIVRYDIPMSWVANTFKKNHRIRIEITSGAENSVFPNPNTGAMTLMDTDSKVAYQRIYSGDEYPSCIVLPIISIKEN